MHLDLGVRARRIRPAVAAVVERVERRVLLAVTAAEYDVIRGIYADFELPADMAQVNIIEITPDQLSVAKLEDAIATAANTTMPDLVVLRTTDTQDTITYTHASADEIRIGIPAAQGALSIVSLGSRPLTLDAANQSRVVSVGLNYDDTTVNLGGMVLSHGNAGSGNGGGICQTSGMLRLVNVTISGNRASDRGGGMYQSGGTSTLTNVIISGNTAYYWGGGIYQSWSTSTLTNVTVSGNQADFAGGLYQDNGTTLMLRNTIVARNSAQTAPDVGGYPGAISGTNNLIGDGSGQNALINGADGNLVGTSGSPVDPLLAEGSSLDLGLTPVAGSPAIDAGDSSLVPAGFTTDIHGAPRIQGAHVNIGAVETVLPFMARVTYVVTSLEDSIAADGVLTLREALAAANTNQAASDAPAGSYSAADRIEFAPGLTGTILTHGQAYQILGSVGVAGPRPDQLTLDAGGQGRVVEVHGMGYTVNLGGLRLTGGNAQSGGGLSNVGAQVTLENMVISGNRASSGGGLYQHSGALTLTNVAVSGNTASSSGGGVYQGGGTLSFANVTVARNTALSTGAGFYQGGGTATLNNSIVARNLSPASPDIYRSGDVVYYGANDLPSGGIIMFPGGPGELSGANNLIGDGAGQRSLLNGVNGNLVGTSSSPIDPLLAEGSTFGIGFSLREGSPAIGAGNNSLILPGITTDLYGAARIQGARVNIGAVETVLPFMPGVSYVVTSLEDSVADDGVITLREALAAANSNQTVGDAPAGSYAKADWVEFAPGLAGTILTHGQPYQILGSLGIAGPGADQLTLDAGGQGSVVEVRGVGYTVDLRGLRLTGGNAERGGGLSNVGAQLTLENLEAIGNAASSGGGIYQYLGTLTLTDATISGNTTSVATWDALHGGGISLEHSSSTLTNVVISGNMVSRWNEYGGGLYQSDGTLTMTNVTLRDNTAYAGGAGLYQDHGTSALTNAVISGNRAMFGAGGGIYLLCGTSTLVNALISGNSAYRGGGVYQSDVTGRVELFPGTATLTNVTISGNSASQSGGGAYLHSGTATLRNTIVARNTAGSAPDLFRNAALGGANNLIGNGTGQTSLVSGVNGNLVGTATSPLDPGFASMAGTDWTQWDLRLTAGSPAVNSGSNALIPAGITTDITGSPRTIGGTADMGAYEFDPPPTITATSINDGSLQRSMVKQLSVTFSEPVTLSTDALTVKLSTGAAVPNTTVEVANPSADQRTYILTFSGSAVIGGSLPDGIYDLLISATGVQDLSGNPLTADYSRRFHRLFGDSDGNKVVNALDYVRLKNTLGRSSSDPLFNSAFDYEGNGLINALDLARFRQRYGLVYSY